MSGNSPLDQERWVIGQMYRVPWSPNPHRLEGVRQQHCQLHGEPIGWTLELRKRRNSEVRPWGSISCASPEQDIRPWNASPDQSGAA